MVDRSTRWAEAVPLVNTSTASCAATFFNCWVSRFRVPAVLTSDRGVQFSSAVWGELCSTLEISHSHATAYHPQANGLVERFHRQLKDALRPRLDNQDWPSHLPWALLGLRAFLQMRWCTASPLALPGDFVDSSAAPPVSFIQQLRERMSQFQPPPTRPIPVQHASHQEAVLHKAEFVYIRRGAAASSISPLYSGPYRVISRGEKTFHMNIGGRDEVAETSSRFRIHTTSIFFYFFLFFLLCKKILHNSTVTVLDCIAEDRKFEPAWFYFDSIL
jgi:hypothetical protein